MRSSRPSIILNLLRSLNSMIDNQLGACWNLSPKIWTETIIVCDHILRMLFSCTITRSHIFIWVISYVFHDCHLICCSVFILRLLCSMLMIRYWMRIRTERLLWVLSLTNTKVWSYILQFDRIRDWLIDFFTISWTSNWISCCYSSYRLLLYLLCWISYSLRRWGLCGRSFVKVKNRLDNLIDLWVSCFWFCCFLIYRRNNSIWIWHNFPIKTLLLLFYHLRSRWSNHLLKRRLLNLARSANNHSFWWGITSLICK